MINKIKIILLLIPIACFSRTFDENFSSIIDSYKTNFEEDGQIKIIFSNDYKKDLKMSAKKDAKILLLFFPENCGLSFFAKSQNHFLSIDEVRDYISSAGFKIINFQIISEIAHFKDFNDMNSFYLKYFNEKADYELVENKFANHQYDYFFPIKFCLVTLEKDNFLPF